MVLYRHAITLSTYAEDGDEQSFWQDWWTLPWWMWLVQGFWVLSTFIQYMALYVAVEDKFCFKTPAVRRSHVSMWTVLECESPLCVPAVLVGNRRRALKPGTERRSASSRRWAATYGWCVGAPAQRCSGQSRLAVT